MNTPLHRSGRAQAAVELVIISIVLLGLFVVVGSILSSKTDQVYGGRTRLLAGQLASAISLRADIVHLTGEGTVATLSAPPSLKDSTTFTLQVINSTLEVRFGGEGVQHRLLSPTVADGSLPVGGVLVFNNTAGGLSIG